MKENTSNESQRQSALQATASAGFHIPSLDGIRALAFTLVFVSHAGLGYIVPGGFGVTVFFFLSGYLITSLLRFEYEKTGWIDLSKFYLRRLYRIFPAMYLTLGVGATLVLLGVFENQLTFAGIAAQLLQLTNYQAIFGGSSTMVPHTSIFWSLAIEEHFYLLFPLALLTLVVRSSYATMTKILLLLCVVMLVWRCVLVFGLGLGHDYIYYASDTRIDSLLYGCILALWGNPFFENNSLLEAGRYKHGRNLIFAASIGLLVFTFVYRNEHFRETARYTMQGVALLPLFYYAVKYSHWPIFRWLELSPVRWVGILSYTLYLSHLLALEVAGQILSTDESGLYRSLLGLGLALGYSALMFAVVERPLGSLRRKLHSNSRKQTPHYRSDMHTDNRG